MELLWITFLLQVCLSTASIRPTLLNRLVNPKVQPVGANVAKSFVPLTEIPPPPHEHHEHKRNHTHSGRRHLPDICTTRKPGEDFHEGGKVRIEPDYYDDKVAKTMATIIFPDHIDRKHFEVTTQEPYMTVGTIDGLGYHPSTMKSDQPSECEQIYQDHLDEQYTQESKDYSEESLEMARMPVFEDDGAKRDVERKLEDVYIDFK